MTKELIERARTKAAVLRMGEPIEFGSDAAIIEELADALEGGVTDGRYPSVFYSNDRSVRVSATQYRGYDTITINWRNESMDRGCWYTSEFDPEEARQLALHILAKPALQAALSAPAQRVEEGLELEIGDGALTWRGDGYSINVTADEAVLCVRGVGAQIVAVGDDLLNAVHDASPAPAPHAGNETDEQLFNALYPFIGSANSTRVAVQELHRLGLTPAPHAGVDADIPDYDAGLLNDFGGGDVSWWQDYLRAEIERANQHWRAALGDRT